MAIIAGGFGSFPAPESRYIDSSSFSNCSSNSSCRCARRKPNSLRVRSSRFIRNCSWRLSSCRGLQWRIAIASPRESSLPTAEDHACGYPVDPPIASDRSAGGFKPIGALGSDRLLSSATNSEFSMHEHRGLVALAGSVTAKEEVVEYFVLQHVDV